MLSKIPSIASRLAGGLLVALAFVSLPACGDSGEQRKDGAPDTPDAKSLDAKAPPDSKTQAPSIAKFKAPDPRAEAERIQAQIAAVAGK